MPNYTNYNCLGCCFTKRARIYGKKTEFMLVCTCSSSPEFECQVGRTNGCNCWKTIRAGKHKTKKQMYNINYIEKKEGKKT